MRPRQWQPYELHTHTFHSDGEHSLLELARSAKEIGLFGIAMTDHNTMSPLLDREAVQAETGLHIVRGMEWTTFFGHMLAVGIHDYVDWRDLGRDDIHKGIERVHEQGGIVGIAHPFRVGSPLCTGCYWEYTVSDWRDIDYIEVWSYTFPSILTSNQRAFELWTAKLNEGFRITAVCGRDWHVSSKKTEEPVAVSYLGMEREVTDAADGENDCEKQAVEAIRSGAVSVTMGPLLQLTVRTESAGRSATYAIGEEAVIRGGESAEAQIELDFSARAGYWELPDQLLTVKLTSNLGQLAEMTVTREAYRASCPVDTADVIWLRAELYGTIRGTRTMVAFTNPVYIRQEA